VSAPLAGASAPSPAPLLAARGLVKHYPIRRGLLQRRVGAVRAVDGVDLDVRAGECLALVGESGSGKTTLGRLVTRLVEPDAGALSFAGEDLLALRGEALRRRRRDIQVVFQDPWGSLNPRMRVGTALREPLIVHRLLPRREQADRVAELLGLVGLPAELARRFPHELSGGQRQRVGIARALATGPRLIVADEPVSALDVSVRAQIVNLLAELQRRLGLAMLFIAHDLALVEQLADRVAVMYLGRIVEQGTSRDLFAAPQHPYTVSLLASVPVPDPGHRPRAPLAGEPPSPAAPPPGCRFHPRCAVYAWHAAKAGERPPCPVDEPVLAATAGGPDAACHYPGEAGVGETFGPWRRMDGQAQVRADPPNHDGSVR
jgi:peptide/nickel transport system ATP-binding protein/oligopeptide transport system ATP-binding protein